MLNEKESKKENIGIKENQKTEKAVDTETVAESGVEVAIKKGKVTTVTVGPDDAALLFQASGHVRVIHNLEVEDYIPDSVSAAFAIYKAIKDNSKEYIKLCDDYLEYAIKAQIESDKKEKESVTG